MWATVNAIVIVIVFVIVFVLCCFACRWRPWRWRCDEGKVRPRGNKYILLRNEVYRNTIEVRLIHCNEKIKLR